MNSALENLQNEQDRILRSLPPGMTYKYFHDLLGKTNMTPEEIGKGFEGLTSLDVALENLSVADFQKTKNYHSPKGYEPQTVSKNGYVTVLQGKEQEYGAVIVPFDDAFYTNTIHSCTALAAKLQKGIEEYLLGAHIFARADSKPGTTKDITNLFDAVEEEGFFVKEGVIIYNSLASDIKAPKGFKTILNSNQADNDVLYADEHGYATPSTLALWNDKK